MGIMAEQKNINVDVNLVGFKSNMIMTRKVTVIA